jgi:fluoride ion exporter CrcB/FEX
MKTKILILALLVLVTVVFLFAPYKLYTSAWPVITPNCSSSIAKEFPYVFDWDWMYVSFVFIFLPILLAIEIFFSKNLSSKKWKVIFVIQGIAGILTTYGMYFLMTFYLIESDVRLTPIFYISLLFVLASGVGSILMGVGKINNLVMRTVGTSRP